MAEEASPTPIPTPTPISVAIPQLSSTSLVHKLLLKLDDSNFLSWKQHVEGIVRTHRLQSFLLHQPEIPPRFLSDEDRANSVENPAFLVWEQQDSALFTWLLSSLSPSVLPTVVNCQHSWQIWEAVLDFFHAHSLAQSTQLRSELRSITKGSKNTSDYLKRIKSIVNALISIGDPVTYREHLEAIFDGLPEDYSHLMTIVTSREFPCSISQAEAMVIAHEARLDRLRLRQHAASPPSAFLAQGTAPPQSTPQAPPLVPSQSPAPPQAPPPVAIAPPSSEVNYVSRTGSDDRAYEDRDDDRSRSDDNRDRGGYNNRGRGGRGGYNNRGRGGDRSSVQCQICHKYGHDASICYYRGNSTSPATNSQPNMPHQALAPVVAPTFGFGSSFGMMPQFGYSPFRGFQPYGAPSQFGMSFPNSGFGSGSPYASGGLFTPPGYGFGSGPPGYGFGSGFGLPPRAPAPQIRAPHALLASAPSTLGN